MTHKRLALEDFGYSPFFNDAWQKLRLDTAQVARVTSEHRGAYTVVNERGEYLAQVTGKRMHKASTREDFPAVGDWVAIIESAPGRATISTILPRKTIIKRVHGDRTKKSDATEVQIIGANIDVAFIVESMDRDYSVNRLERYFVLARDGGVVPAIILNKTDLISKDELASRLSDLLSRFPDVDIITTNITDERSLNALQKYVERGKTYCFLGSSGVGKSSLIKWLVGGTAIQTGSISLASGRGTHVTTRREMYFLPDGGIVIDNPGMREVDTTDAAIGLEESFDEIIELTRTCKYSDCAHRSEPGCALIAAVASGDLAQSRYENYLRMQKEADFTEMSAVEKRRKDKRFGKFVKQAKKDLKKYK